MPLGKLSPGSWVRVSRKIALHSVDSTTKSLSFGMAFVLAVGVGHISAQQSPREQLSLYIADLQKNSSDDALREKIIKLALTLDPKPAVPTEVDELAGRAKYILEHATSNTDYAAAADAFAKASLLAPWVPDYYFDQAQMLDKENHYQEAVKDYQFYLMAAPNAQDAKAVRERIGGLKYEIEKEDAAEAADRRRRQAELEAEREREREAESAREQQQEAERERLLHLDPLIRSLDGAVYRVEGHDSSGNRLIRTYTISGDRINYHSEFYSAYGALVDRNDHQYAIDGKTFIIPWEDDCRPFSQCHLVATISDAEITFAFWGDGSVRSRYREAWGGDPRRIKR